MDWEVGSHMSSSSGNGTPASFDFMDDVSDMFSSAHHNKHEFDWMENIIKL